MDRLAVEFENQPKYEAANNQSPRLAGAFCPSPSIVMRLRVGAVCSPIACSFFCEICRIIKISKPADLWAPFPTSSRLKIGSEASPFRG